MEKILATIYLFFLFFLAMVYLFYQISELTDRRKARKQMQAAREQMMPYKPEPVIDVVGKSSTVFLAPLPSVHNDPFMSDNLEKEPATKTELDILPETVETNLNSPVILEEDEVEDYSGEPTDLEGNFSQGLTYQQISEAIDVVEGRKTGKTEEHLAGETFTVMPDDFVNMIQCRLIKPRSSV